VKLLTELVDIDSTVKILVMYPDNYR